MHTRLPWIHEFPHLAHLIILPIDIVYNSSIIRVDNQPITERTTTMKKLLILAFVALAVYLIFSDVLPLLWEVINEPAVILGGL